MNTKQIMTTAWTIARQGAAKFGGSVRSYIAEALRLVWSGKADIFVAGPALTIRVAGPHTVTHNGTSFLIDGIAGQWVEGGREFRRLAGADLPAGKIGAVMAWIGGRKVFITLTSGEYFAGKSNPEAKRLYAHHHRDDAARKFWDGINENRDGYNPFRA